MVSSRLLTHFSSIGDCLGPGPAKDDVRKWNEHHGRNRRKAIDDEACGGSRGAGVSVSGRHSSLDRFARWRGRCCVRVCVSIDSHERHCANECQNEHCVANKEPSRCSRHRHLAVNVNDWLRPNRRWFWVCRSVQAVIDCVAPGRVLVKTADLACGLRTIRDEEVTTPAIAHNNMYREPKALPLLGRKRQTPRPEASASTRFCVLDSLRHSRNVRYAAGEAAFSAA